MMPSHLPMAQLMQEIQHKCIYDYQITVYLLYSNIAVIFQEITIVLFYFRTADEGFFEDSDVSSDEDGVNDLDFDDGGSQRYNSYLFLINSNVDFKEVCNHKINTDHKFFY